MIKKNRKWIVGILSLCLIWCLSLPIPVYALNPNVHLNNATISFNNGNPYVISQNGRNLYLIDLGDYKSGTITLNFSYSSWVGTILFSGNDYPDDVIVGYYFKSSDTANFSSSSMSPFNFSNIRYIYVGTNRAFTYTITYNEPDPTPTNTPTPTPTDTPTPTPSPDPTDPINPPVPSYTPTPMPTGSGGSGIPLHYVIPFDYYMIAIIILLGGILVCQLFKN